MYFRYKKPNFQRGLYMPSQSEKIALKREQKRSVKLTDKQREEIIIKYSNGGYSQNGLAKEYAVSRRLITFILDPNKLEENKKRRDERGGSMIYYDREKHTQHIREYRRYKQELYLKGELDIKRE